MFGLRFHFQDVRRLAQRLLAVAVDDGGQVAEPVVGGEHDRFPYRSLIALGVAEQGVGTPGRAVEAGCQCGSGREG